jgi:hypothetical protein
LILVVRAGWVGCFREAGNGSGNGNVHTADRPRIVPFPPGSSGTTTRTRSSRRTRVPTVGLIVESGRVCSPWKRYGYVMTASIRDEWVRNVQHEATTRILCPTSWFPLMINDITANDILPTDLCRPITTIHNDVNRVAPYQASRPRCRQVWDREERADRWWTVRMG